MEPPEVVFMKSNVYISSTIRYNHINLKQTTMKSNFVLTALFTFITLSSFSQKGKNEIGVGGEMAFPSGKDFSNEFNTGFGGWVKFRLGVGKKNGQVTFSTGYTNFNAKGSGSQFSASVGIIPLLLGYRYVVASGFYLEPQAGYGSYHAKYSEGGQSISGSQGGFTYAMGLGYEVSNIDFGVRFQNATINDASFSNIAVRVGYNFALKGK